MDCTLTRTEARIDGIFGEMTVTDNGNRIAATLEHSYPIEVENGIGVYLPKIPAGTYICERYLSPKHGYEVFRLRDVPGSTFDEIHIGNFNEDSDGCILVGFQAILFPQKSRSMITFSKDTFEAFMIQQARVTRFTLTIKDQA